MRQANRIAMALLSLKKVPLWVEMWDSGKGGHCVLPTNNERTCQLHLSRWLNIARRQIKSTTFAPNARIEAQRGGRLLVKKPYECTKLLTTLKEGRALPSYSPGTVSKQTVGLQYSSWI
jgi:hypothetical protein